ncbi:type VI secretion system tip protein TssI/VgrG [Rhodanobacter sp. DHB23]|uniref:type VI secretion system Vgr family protein n=1 Tax=Rhodanobacter sp. DHB23 TaxID=2775923 RepID=UPI00177A9F35|nr:type VI secretion system tip protein TssI/VgrG [Rhodanobacter sp. DHB23]MBD8871357.1 type VI secretion system tip protein VgrG [Rhodanobacter sp. DHB23]
MSEPITITSSKCDDLFFMDMEAHEQLGELFRYEVRFGSQDVQIDLTALLGSSMTVTLELDDGFERHFNGMVCEASQHGFDKVESLVYAQYAVTLVPTPWLLGQIVDCRIFTDQAVPDIVKLLLQESGYTDVKLSLTGNYAKREYCVQYREDCLSFIQRLMEQEGIYYFFTHEQGKHTMVLADGVGAHSAAGKFDKVPFVPGADDVLSNAATVTAFGAVRGVDAATVKLTDYNPLTPKASLLATQVSSGNSPAVKHSAFDFPGAHGDAGLGQHYASMRAEAVTAARSRYHGMTSSCAACIGNLFTLGDNPRGELNQEYLLTGTEIHLQGGGRASGSGSLLEFHCDFLALPGSVPFRTAQRTARPKIAGLQTATVTGSDTDEDIAVDKYGRVQVNFHWNMPDKPNAKCSCPVRVASPWAGKGWGAVSLPRVGQEVVVSFLEGDPDRPLIIGSVYNAANTVPYGLPDNKTQSGIKSRSLLGGADDANELRFEDKKGEEDFFIHAQKDMHEEVEHDHVVTIDHDETITVKNDQTTTVKHNQALTVENDQTTEVKHDQTLTVDNNQTAEVKNNQTLTVDNDQTETVKHNRSVTVQNDDSLSVTGNGTSSIGKKFSLTAGTEIDLVCGAASITLKSSGEIDIKGVNISISGDATVKVAGQASVDIGSGASVKVHSDAMMDVEGSAMTTVKGAMLQLNADAMAKLGGAITMIG